MFDLDLIQKDIDSIPRVTTFYGNKISIIHDCIYDIHGTLDHSKPGDVDRLSDFDEAIKHTKLYKFPYIQTCPDGNNLHCLFYMHH